MAAIATDLSALGPKLKAIKKNDLMWRDVDSNNARVAR